MSSITTTAVVTARKMPPNNSGPPQKIFQSPRLPPTVHSRKRQTTFRNAEDISKLKNRQARDPISSHPLKAMPANLRIFFIIRFLWIARRPARIDITGTPQKGFTILSGNMVKLQSAKA